jgi:LCP family protein required for cell wall assembly
MGRKLVSEKLIDIDRDFKKEKGRKLVWHYLKRIIAIVLLLLVIASSYTFYLGYDIQRKLASHAGIKYAKKVLAEKPLTDEPFNVLIIGSDSRGEERGRSDTIIILRVVPKEKKGFLISIPRDYRVEIPGHGKRKINAAYALGGAALTIKTISNFLGIPIHHYAIIDFKGFVKVVDALGGVTINVEKRLYEPNSSKVNLYPGVQRLNGSQALAYVRFRHDEEGDFGRIRRQQQFLKAVAAEMLKPSAVPKYPRIANIVAENVETDMSLNEILSLARYFAQSGGIKIYSVMLPGAPKNIGGASYVIPDQAKVELIIKKIMEENRLPTAQELIDPSTVTVKVFNGAGIPGLARAASSYLRDLGFTVYGSRNADRFDYQQTLIVYKPGHEQEAKLVKDLFGRGEIVLADNDFLKMIGKASIGIIAGFDLVDYQPIKERMPQ